MQERSRIKKKAFQKGIEEVSVWLFVFHFAPNSAYDVLTLSIYANLRYSFISCNLSALSLKAGHGILGYSIEIRGLASDIWFTVLKKLLRYRIEVVIRLCAGT